MKKVLQTFLMFLPGIALVAQNPAAEVVKPIAELVKEVTKKNFYIGVETGVTNFNAFEKDHDFIREEASYYYGYYGNYSALSLTSYSTYASVNAEYRIFNGAIWFSGGLKYSELNSSISKSSGSSNHPDFFYVLLNQQQDESYYYRVSEVRFQNHYIGIPLDVNFAPLSTRYVKFYGKIGADLNFRLATTKSATFYEETMNNYENHVISLFDNPGNFYATAGIGGGMQIGENDHINARLELDLATIVLTPDAFALVNQNVGFGANFSLLIPIK